MKSKKNNPSTASSDPRLVCALERLRRSSRRYGRLKEPAAEAYLRFVYTHGQMMGYFMKKIQPFGLTRAGFNVLTILRAREGRGCPHHEIGELLLVSKANVTGLIHSLTRDGLVERVYDKKDRRVCLVRISSKGEKLLEALLPKYHARIEEIFSCLSRSEKVLLSGFMEKILTQIKELKA